MKAREAEPAKAAEWVSPPVMEVTAEQLAQVLACSAFNVRQLAVNGVITKNRAGALSAVRFDPPLLPSTCGGLATSRGEGTPAAEKRRLAKAQADHGGDEGEAVCRASCFPPPT